MGSQKPRCLAPRPARASTQDPVLTVTKLPVSLLRERLVPGQERSCWKVDSDGVLGRVLEMKAGSVVTYPLRLDGSVDLITVVRLYPHDWRDRQGTVRASVTVETPDAVTELWSGVLRAGDRGRPAGVSVQVTLPPETTTMHLRVDPLREPSAAVTLNRAIFVDPALGDRSGPARRPPTFAATPPTWRPTDEPLFSVLVPVHDPPVAMLAEAVESVRAQTFGDWELCLSDDGSRNPEVIAALERHAAEDPRIRLVRHAPARGISAATNAALQLARGTYIALLDHDDMLAPDALERVAAAIAAEPGLDMVYTDEDIVDGGRQVWVHLKPAWSPDTLRTNGYTCHLGVYRRSLVQEIGGFRTEFDGSQDIDMILRLTERSDRVAHVPGILYHWRAHAASTAGGDAKPYAYVAARNAYAAHLKRAGVSARVGYGPPGLYRVACEVDPMTPVALVLAVSDAAGLASAARTWSAQDHPAWSLTLTAPLTAHEEITRVLDSAGVSPDRVTLLDAAVGDNRAQSLARGAHHAAARSEFVALMQSPAAGITGGWMRRLLGYAAQPEIAAAGPVVLAPDGRVAHAGVALPEGVPLYLLHGRRTSMDDFFGYGTSVHNVTALSGALVTGSATLRELGGLDRAFGDLVLVDYCVRAREAGGRIVTVPDARLRLSAGDDATNDLPTMSKLAARWSARHTGDPYYNPGYRTDRGDFARRES